MSRSGERRGTVLGVALLCLLAWLGTALHVALEPHDHEFARVALDGHHGAGHEHHEHHERDEHDEHERQHDADDHLLPASSRPTPGAAAVLTFAPPPVHVAWEPCSNRPAPAPPREDAGPTTDPPSTSRRPRAPPVG